MSPLCKKFIEYRRSHLRCKMGGVFNATFRATLKGTLKGGVKGTGKGIGNAPLVHALTGVKNRDVALIATWNPKAGKKHIPQSVFLDVYMSDADECIFRAKRRARFGARVTGTHPPSRKDKFLWMTFWRAYRNAKAAAEKA